MRRSVMIASKAYSKACSNRGAVFGILKSLLDNPQREARRLNRDAPAIIESATRSMPVGRVREIALMTLEHVNASREHLDQHTQSREQMLYRFRQLHGDAKRRMDQVGLTAYTLVIIQLRAAALGEIAAPARQAIEEFTDQWAHAVEGPH
jgi:hypothetical protein